MAYNKQTNDEPLTDCPTDWLTGSSNLFGLERLLLQYLWNLRPRLTCKQQSPAGGLSKNAEYHRRDKLSAAFLIRSSRGV